mgnify:CR=1 FL=1
MLCKYYGVRLPSIDITLEFALEIIRSNDISTDEEDFIRETTFKAILERNLYGTYSSGGCNGFETEDNIRKAESGIANARDAIIKAEGISKEIETELDKCKGSVDRLKTISKRFAKILTKMQKRKRNRNMDIPCGNGDIGRIYYLFGSK